MELTIDKTNPTPKLKIYTIDLVEQVLNTTISEEQKQSASECNPDYHFEGGNCTSNTKIVSITNGSGTQTWNGTSWDSTVLSSCNTGFHTEDNITCINDIQGCIIINGTGTDTWDGSSWNCSVTTCDTDYYNLGDNTCTSVGNGYYSNSTDTTRAVCTNNPDTTSRNYTYTTDGNGTNNCTATYIDLCGLDLYETVNGICAAVGNGYYSTTNNNTRTACSTNPDTTSRDYTYTTDGNGTNACTATYTQLCGLDLYELSNGVCSVVGNGSYSTAGNNSIISCSNKPSYSTYTSGGNGANDCTWTCSDGYGLNGSICSLSQGGVCNNSTPLGCSTGNAINNNGQSSCGTSRTWNCTGLYGGNTSSQCSYYNGGCLVNGACGGSANSCSAGSASGYSAGSCGGSKTWSCIGSNGGSTANCSIANAACPTSGPYSYGSRGTCSKLCGGGIQYRAQYCYYDSCYSPQATSLACNTQICCAANMGSACIYIGTQVFIPQPVFSFCGVEIYYCGTVSNTAYCIPASTGDYVACKVNGTIQCGGTCQ